MMIVNYHSENDTGRPDTYCVHSCSGLSSIGALFLLIFQRAALRIDRLADIGCIQLQVCKLNIRLMIDVMMNAVYSSSVSIRTTSMPEVACLDQSQLSAPREPSVDASKPHRHSVNAQYQSRYFCHIWFKHIISINLCKGIQSNLHTKYASWSHPNRVSHTISLLRRNG